MRRPPLLFGLLLAALAPLAAAQDPAAAVPAAPDTILLVYERSGARMTLTHAARLPIGWLAPAAGAPATHRVVLHDAAGKVLAAVACQLPGAGERPIVCRGPGGGPAQAQVPALPALPLPGAVKIPAVEGLATVTLEERDAAGGWERLRATDADTLRTLVEAGTRAVGAVTYSDSAKQALARDAKAAAAAQAASPEGKR